VSDRLRVYWSGGFFTNASLAIVNRRLVRALIDRGNVEIAIGTDPLVPDALPDELRRLAAHSAFGAERADVTVVHTWPPRLAACAGLRYVHVQPWEHGSMPAEWYAWLRDDCDDVWTHSTYNRRTYLDAGMPPERVAVIPHGVDLQIFKPDGPKMRTSGGAFRFLFVGGTLTRKGIDLLVNAYVRAFTARDDVVLMIKDVNAATFYRGQTRGAEIRAIAQRPGVARIEYVDATLPDEGMAQLFRAADCLVLPYRGEGFGLPVIEAMASGLPVIVTAGGATDDFVDESVGWRIASRRRELEPAESPLPTVTPAWLLEPDLDALIDALRHAYLQPDDARRRGQAAARRARTWTWDRAATIAERRLHEVFEREPMPARRRDERYRDPQLYEEQIFGTGKLDGIVLETFRRLGVQRASFVELSRHGTFAVAPVLARGMHWHGLVVEREARAAPIAATRYAGAPNTAVIAERFTPASVAPLLAAHGIAPGFDLLALGCEDAAEIWEALAPFSPRAVACAAGSAAGLEASAARLGYEHVASESARGDALFVRNDLAERAAFRPRVAAHAQPK
jgi:glycosyltransferase involved in cell wall biosynthesis